MPAFPRTIKPKQVTPFRVPTGLVARGQTGRDQRRAVVAIGREWDEIFGPMKAGTAAVDALLAFIENAWNLQSTFTIEHYISPGSGIAPHGSGGGTPRVNGADQAGALLVTDGWPGNESFVVQLGDVIGVAGLPFLLRVISGAIDDPAGNATISISPPIPAGSSPADDALITTTGNLLTAYIAAKPLLPAARPGRRIDGLTLTFREAL